MPALARPHCSCAAQAFALGAAEGGPSVSQPTVGLSGDSASLRAVPHLGPRRAERCGDVRGVKSPPSRARRGCQMRIDVDRAGAGRRRPTTRSPYPGLGIVAERPRPKVKVYTVSQAGHEPRPRPPSTAAAVQLPLDRRTGPSDQAHLQGRRADCLHPPLPGEQSHEAPAETAARRRRPPSRLPPAAGLRHTRGCQGGPGRDRSRPQARRPADRGWAPR